MANTHIFSRNEEVANSITHGIGAILSIAALVILIVFPPCMERHGTL